jgi:NAD(P)-dependent dehydrogenase (short-subunit alcohol dehydrogenase family)
MAKYGFATEGRIIVSDFSSQIQGKVFLVTGPSEGEIGAETAVSLAHNSPSTIILLGRSLPKIQPTTDAIHTSNSSTLTKFIPVNLDSLASVRRAAHIILEDIEIPIIDAVINNAAIMACPYALAEDGFESQFATNHLSHFLLTNLLMPKIVLTTEKRIVSVSSAGQFRSAIRFEDLAFSKGEKYDPWEAYGQSKTANILVSVALNQTLGSKGVKAFVLNPGSIASGLQKYMTGEMRRDDAIKHLVSMGHEPPKRKTLQQGCATTLRAALDPTLSVDGPISLQDCQIAVAGKDVMEFALDDESARKLWIISEEMVGEIFEY